MTNPTRILPILAFLLLAYGLPHATTQQPPQQPARRSIRGRARYSSGASASWIIVRLLSSKYESVGVNVTNHEGEFAFSDLGENTYTLVMVAPGYQVVTERVSFAGRVPAGVAHRVELTLVPDNTAQPSSAPAPFVQNVPKNAREVYERAMKLGKAGRKQVAAALLQEAVRIFPDYFDAHFALASELIKAARLEEAILELEQATRINPRDDRVYQTFGVLLMKQGKFDVAAALFAEATRLNPGQPLHPLMRATALMDYASALNASQPDGSGAATEREAAFAEAERNLILANERSNKQLAVVHMQMARLYQKRGERERAADELDQYLLTSPNAKDAEEIRDIIKKLRLPGGEPAPPR